MGSTAEATIAEGVGWREGGRQKGTHMKNPWSHRATSTTRVCGGALKGRGAVQGAQSTMSCPACDFPKGGQTEHVGHIMSERILFSAQNRGLFVYEKRYGIFHIGICNRIVEMWVGV